MAIAIERRIKSSSDTSKKGGVLKKTPFTRTASPGIRF
jgi:hypothetical protein